ncbi:DUF721 domain-containing protein [Actinomyces faecalis]|uniref:DUF721 domain-containing protein n=1 Tax=Actinomyces faecalis TaxID=2722820 RepID=UPI002E29621A|nr:DUF721 domain-containing protein [Actinomyces faecalis]
MDSQAGQPRGGDGGTPRGRSEAARRDVPLPQDGADVDALALAQLARLQEQAWTGGVARSSLRRNAVGEDGVAAWDAPRARRSAREDEDPETDRGPGLPPGRDRPGPTRFDPRTGKRELARAVVERGWAGKLAMAQVVVAWERIVGPQIAEHAEVVAFEEGRLDVRSSSSAWAQQLRLMMPSISVAVAHELERLYPGRRVPAVEIRVLGPGSPTWRHGRFGGARGGRGPRDTYG